CFFCFFFSSRRRHTRLQGDWSSDVCSSDLSTYTCVTFAIWIQDRRALQGKAIFNSESFLSCKPLLVSPSSKWVREENEINCAGRSEERRVGKECRSRWSE